MTLTDQQQYEIIVIGAGPAGLTAALYLARYRRDVLVVHNCSSRALRIPETHNAPGFYEGIEGPKLIERMTLHATMSGATITEAEVLDIEIVADSFRVISNLPAAWKCRAVILATGTFDNEVDLPHNVHEKAIGAGVLRYCPICDGFEHRNGKIGVIGCDNNGAAEALFLRQYSEDVTLMPLSYNDLVKDEKIKLAEAGIAVKLGALGELEPHDDRMKVWIEGESAPFSFDVVYPALGSRPRTELAQRLNIPVLDKGSLSSDAIKNSGIPGFFAAGDVIDGLDQISVAIGHGAMAATNAHNWLRKRDRYTLSGRG